MQKSLISTSILALSTIAAFSVFACILLGLYLITGIGLNLPFKESIAIACSVITLYVAYRTAPPITVQLEKLSNINRLWMYAVVSGIVLRLGMWLMTLPVVQVNDGLRYLELAERLYTHQAYELDGYAFWPPGTPFIYSAFMWVLGQPAWLAVVVNSLFFLLTALSIRSICRSLDFQPHVAGIAVAVLAFWPAAVLPISQVSKEMLLLGILPAATALLLLQWRWASLCAGLVTGMGILTQPALLFLPLFFCAALMTTRISFKILASRMVLLLSGALLVIAPWSYRNFQIFGEFVPISTNAGLVLHAGNQPDMVKPLGQVGGFLQPPAPPVPVKDDLHLSRWHKSEAMHFITQNKGDFAKLVWNRVIITMGDDSDSAYRSLRLTEKMSNSAYMQVKALNNAYWLVLMALVAVTCLSIRGKPVVQELAPLVIIATGSTLYLMAVHGVAEGGARHHLAWSWIYALILSAGLAQARRQNPFPLHGSQNQSSEPH